MIPRTQDIQPEANGAAHAPDSSERFTDMPGNSPLTATLDLATEVAARYDISDLSGLLASARALSGEEEISAVSALVAGASLVPVTVTVSVPGVLTMPSVAA